MLINGCLRGTSTVVLVTLVLLERLVISDNLAYNVGSPTATRRINNVVGRLGTDAKYHCDISLNSLYQHHSGCNAH